MEFSLGGMKCESGALKSAPSLAVVGMLLSLITQEDVKAFSDDTVTQEVDKPHPLPLSTSGEGNT